MLPFGCILIVYSSEGICLVGPDSHRTTHAATESSFHYRGCRLPKQQGCSYQCRYAVSSKKIASAGWFFWLDIAMGDSGVRRSIVTELSYQFPDLYTDDNIAFVGTHSHAGVGGYMENLLPQLTSLGHVKQTSDAIIAGTVLAVQRAHASLAPGKLSLGNTTILDANINRSPTAYLANPADERARYQYDVDKDMTVLRFDDLDGNARGLLTFFPVHGTSLYEVRHLYLS
jgi:Neutral/alkaline non-lysosomal ceramidase, N-terminal